MVGWWFDLITGQKSKITLTLTLTPLFLVSGGASRSPIRRIQICDVMFLVLDLELFGCFLQFAYFLFRFRNGALRLVVTRVARVPPVGFGSAHAAVEEGERNEGWPWRGGVCVFGFGEKHFITLAAQPISQLFLPSSH